MSTLTLLLEYIRVRHLRSRNVAQLRRRQERGVEAHLKWVLERSPYTAERFEGYGVERWREVPTIGKREMMANFHRLNTAGVSLDEAMALAKQDEASRDFNANLDGITVGLSSGTSGLLGLFMATQREQAQWAGTILAKVVPQHILLPIRDRVAFFLRANNSLYERTASKRLVFSFFDLIEEFAQQLSRLRELSPTLLVAPPSLLRQIATEVESGNLKLEPKRVISVAEPLDPIDRARFERTFGQGVHQVYQATEGLLGTTCSHGTLHLNEESIIFEREHLDERRFIPIITDFRRRTQPIIRYRLDDVLLMREEPCPCGSPCLAIESIEGREGDILIGRRGDGGERQIYADFVRRAVLTSSPNIEDYGVRQRGHDQLELYIRPDTAEVRGAATDALTALFEQLNCVAPEVARVDSWPKGGMKKRRRVVRDVESPT